MTTVTHIKVSLIPTEYQLDDSCPLGEKWEFNCTHPSTHMEETIYVVPDHRGEPSERRGADVEVCDNCYDVIEEDQ